MPGWRSHGFWRAAPCLLHTYSMPNACSFTGLPPSFSPMLHSAWSYTTPQRGSRCTPATSAHTVENTLGSSVQNAPVFLSSQLSGFGRLKEGNCGIGKWGCTTRPREHSSHWQPASCSSNSCKQDHTKKPPQTRPFPAGILPSFVLITIIQLQEALQTPELAASCVCQAAIPVSDRSCTPVPSWPCFPLLQVHLCHDKQPEWLWQFIPWHKSLFLMYHKAATKPLAGGKWEENRKVNGSLYSSVYTFLTFRGIVSSCF